MVVIIRRLAFERARWRDGLQLAFQAREGLVVGANPLRHPNREREDGGWQVKPPTCVSSEGGAGSGRESPLSPELRAGGWWLAGKASHTCFERGRVGANPLCHSNREWEGGG